MSRSRQAKVKLSTLNNDVVLQLSDMLSKRDLLSMMTSCQTLFRLGLPVLLQRPYNISASSLQSFHEFLKFTAPSSFCSLRTLMVHDLKLSAVQLRILSKILNQTTKLKRLWISTELLVWDNTLALAVAALTELDFLRFWGYSLIGRPFEVITLLGSPLRELSLNRPTFYRPKHANAHGSNQMISGPGGDTDKIDLIPVIAKFSASLEYVNLVCIDFLDSTISCPKVTRLELYCCGEPRLSTLVPAFPNLDVLIVDNDIYDDSNPKDEEWLVEAFNDNTIFQQQHGSWPSLKFVSTELSTLYELGLQCKVDSLVIASPIRARLSDESDHVNILHQLLSPLQLKHLRLENIDDLTVQGMTSLLSIGLQTLQRLDIYIKISSLDEANYRNELNTITDAIGRLHLSMLNYHLNMGRWLPKDNPGGPEDEFLRGLDPEAVARHIVTAAPTLEYLVLEIGATPGRKARLSYWTVTKSDPRTLNRVLPEDDLAIRSINEMFLPPEALDAIRTAFVH